MKLLDLPLFTRAVIDSIEDDTVNQIMMEKGFFKGRKLQIKNKAPFNGPIIIESEGEVYLMDEKMASLIEVLQE